MSGRLVILDRDGVINYDSDEFIKSADEWRPIEGSIDAIARLSSAGFTVAVATNQSGIARKLIDLPTLESIHRKLRNMVREAGGDLGKIVYCPHHPDESCECRKPAPGMLLKLSRQYGVPLDRVPVVGDSLRDIEAARAAGARPILVLTGNGKDTAVSLAKSGDYVETYLDLAAAAATILADSKAREGRS